MTAASLVSRPATALAPWRAFRGWVRRLSCIGLVLLGVLPTFTGPIGATPANRAGLNLHYDRFLVRKLNQCSTCHQEGKENPATLADLPHNPFGDQLRRLGERSTNSTPPDIASRLQAARDLDADGDGVPNETEILLGHQPGNPKDVPSTTELETLPERRTDFARFERAYRWRPFDTLGPPPAVPVTRNPRWVRNPIDAFIAAARDEKGLQPRPAARREVLLRRVYFDLIGLAPTPDEQRAFLADTSVHAYEKVVDRLLEDPRHGERWGRHWMDIWRYSDWAGWTDGNQVRDSKPHIWRWRDWIVESINADKGYDRMVLEMLAADELAPLDSSALRATGFLVRNYKMLSREQWMEDTLKHTAQAFLGVTLGCAKCHDHMTDPISQADYYRMRAIFEPHHVRTDRLPGELDTAKDGLVRAFDTGSNRVTHFLMRGDERHPDTNRVMSAGVPSALCGQTTLAKTRGDLPIVPVALPFATSRPDHREFVRRDLLDAAARAVGDASREQAQAATNSSLSADKILELNLTVEVAQSKQAALHAVLRVEELEDAGRVSSHEWTLAAMDATSVQRTAAVAEARLKQQQATNALAKARAQADETARATNAVVAAAQGNAGAAKVSGKETSARQAAAEKAARELTAAQKKLEEAVTALATAEKALTKPSSTAYQRRLTDRYPIESSGRRLAFAQWVVDTNNPLTARVAMNHVWLRHFGRGLVPTPTDFGRSGRPPSHPALLDWLAAEFMAQGWSLKAMHRLMVNSSTYRMASTSDEACASVDPDNVWLWRMPSRRLEAEAVRDNLLYVAQDLDPTVGGPEIDHKLGLTSKRRSLYLRLAAEKEVEFLRIFDGPTVTECYERRPSVIPQQALALGNSEIAFRQAGRLATRLSAEVSSGIRPDQADADFIRRAYERILGRSAKSAEMILCRDFLRSHQANSNPAPDPIQSRQRRRENLVLVLLNHNDFVTVR
jgi:hypothetical protein